MCVINIRCSPTAALDSGEAFKLKPANLRAEGAGGASGGGEGKKGRGRRA